MSSWNIFSWGGRPFAELIFCSASIKISWLANFSEIEIVQYSQVQSSSFALK